MNRFSEWLSAQLRPMDDSESVNYRLMCWLTHPIRTWQLWKAHHDPAISRAVKERWEQMAADIASGRMAFRMPDESDADFRARILKQ